jgi:NitT/TauT family transport system substrate-binding protein
VPSVVSGDYQVGFSNATSLIIAASRGLPVQMIAQGSTGGPAPSAKEAYDGVLAKKSSSIRSPKDLEGKTIAVNTLQNVGPLTINNALQKAGADYRTVKYVGIPFPDMNAAIATGRVDAGWMVEPFVTQGTGQGHRAILIPFEETAANLTVAPYFVTKPYAQKNADVVDRLVRAMNRSLQYAQSHAPTIEQTAKLAQQYGFTKKPANLDELIRPQQ